MNTRNVFLTRHLPSIAYPLLDQAQIKYEVWNRSTPPTKEEFLQCAQGKDGIINAGSMKYDEELLASLAHLKVLSLMSVGYDHVNLSAAKKYGIKVGHTPDVLSNATADTAFLLLLASSRMAMHHHKRILNGQWGMFQPTAGLGMELNGKTLGIFGLGKIGMEMARKCKLAYQMKIIYHNRTRNELAETELDATFVSFEELLQQGDVISAHSVLTNETKGTFNKAAFQQMKSSAIFINTGRGGLHVESDLIEALKSNEIWGAGLDVFEQEPTPVNNPLLQMSNVCTLPHIGSATVEARNAMAQLAVQNLIAALNGEKMPAEVLV